MLQPGLSNRVYRIEADEGAFFLRLPEAETACIVDRWAEAENIGIAASLGIALPPLFCDPASGILVTRAVEEIRPSPDNLPSRLGEAVGRLHASGRTFAGQLDANDVFSALKRALGPDTRFSSEIEQLVGIFCGLPAAEAGGPAPVTVPSHGDLSPGNCLEAADRLRLIDWEFSAMADPAWDLAYAILEHGFTDHQEAAFLTAYRESGAEKLVPAPRQLEIMKIRCDAVSALWALEQVRRGSGKTDFLAFAESRRERAIVRARSIIR